MRGYTQTLQVGIQSPVTRIENFDESRNVSSRTLGSFKDDSLRFEDDFTKVYFRKALSAACARILLKYYKTQITSTNNSSSKQEKSTYKYSAIFGTCTIILIIMHQLRLNAPYQYLFQSFAIRRCEKKKSKRYEIH